MLREENLDLCQRYISESETVRYIPHLMNFLLNQKGIRIILWITSRYELRCLDRILKA